MRILFWQDMPSLHQAAHIRALASCTAREVTVVTQSDVAADRRELGWGSPDFGRARLIVSPDAAAIRTMVSQRPAESVHVFSGIRAYPMVAHALSLALATAAHLGLQVERADDAGWMGRARLLRGIWDRRRLARRIGFVLAIGTGAVRWYRRCGYAGNTLYPYGYFIDCASTEADRALPRDPQGSVRLIYVGRCQLGKGGHLLLRALAALPEYPWTLTIVGDGPAKGQWQDLAQHLGLAERVEFIGALPHPLVLDRLDASDLLVLPSQAKDGWGVVINEALMRGVPVVCSDACGAADLVIHPDRGIVVPAGSVTALRDALACRIQHGRRTAELTARIRSWSQNITGEAAAGYLLRVIEASRTGGPKPVPPWLSGDGASPSPAAPLLHGS